MATNDRTPENTAWTLMGPSGRMTHETLSLEAARLALRCRASHPRIAGILHDISATVGVYYVEADAAQMEMDMAQAVHDTRAIRERAAERLAERVRDDELAIVREAQGQTTDEWVAEMRKGDDESLRWEPTEYEVRAGVLAFVRDVPPAEPSLWTRIVRRLRGTTTPAARGGRAAA